MTTSTDDQLRRHLQTLAGTATGPPGEVERDVHARVIRRRRRRRVAPIVGGLAVAGLAVAVMAVRSDEPSDVRLVDEPPTIPPPTDGTVPSGDVAESLRISEVRLGRHDGFDRVVVEFNMNLATDEVAEVDSIAAEGWPGPAFSIEDAPNYGECGESVLKVEGSSFVNVMVPSDWLELTGDTIEPRYRSRDTVKVNEAAVCGPYEGYAVLTIALAAPGEVEATILDDPGRVVIDIR